jgi:hypothetical protein
MVYITDLSDPAFHTNKVIDAINAGHKVILITKNPGMIHEDIHRYNMSACIKEKALAELSKNVLFQVTVTGLGGTVWEPDVPTVKQVMNDIARLKAALNLEVALRYDPIIPGVNDSVGHMKYVLEMAKLIGIDKVTASVMDMYPHVQERIMKAKLPMPFQTFHYQDNGVLIERFVNVAIELGFQYRICCELGFPSGQGGCDWPDMILSKEELAAMPAGCQRANCGCPKYTQLLSYANKCFHDCLYCYRKDR